MPHKTNGRFSWGGDEKMNAVTYHRNLDATQFLPYEEKFSGLLGLCDVARDGDFQIVSVAQPEILGDDYEELVANLRRLADAGLLVTFGERKVHA
jgi:hypothetical protein